MKRRKFLLLGSLLGLTPYVRLQAQSGFERDFLEVKETIEAVQMHMFPEASRLPSAKQMQTIAFLYETISHKSFDRDIRAFVIEGAKELIAREKGRFVEMSPSQKERALRAYEETSYGSAWLARIMTLGMEALFSDPIYGSNRQEQGWKALSSYGGYPRAKVKYLGV